MRGLGLPIIDNGSHIVPVHVGNPVHCKMLSDMLLDQFGMGIPAFAQSTPVAGVNVGDIIFFGASDRPDRAANEVMGMLLAHGYQVIPVNPQLAGQVIHGQTVVATLAEALRGAGAVIDFTRSGSVAARSCFSSGTGAGACAPPVS